jgi:hypothetical protein
MLYSVSGEQWRGIRMLYSVTLLAKSIHVHTSPYKSRYGTTVLSPCTSYRTAKVSWSNSRKHCSNKSCVLYRSTCCFTAREMSSLQLVNSGEER